LALGNPWLRSQVDIEPAREILRSIIESGEPAPSQIVVAVAIHVARQEYIQAKSLLTQTEESVCSL
jgi:hypothetical protein